MNVGRIGRKGISSADPEVTLPKEMLTIPLVANVPWSHELTVPPPMLFRSAEADSDSQGGGPSRVTGPGWVAGPGPRSIWGFRSSVVSFTREPVTYSFAG